MKRRDTLAQAATAGVTAGLGLGPSLPLLDRVQIDIIEASQPRWLAFLNGPHDIIELLCFNREDPVWYHMVDVLPGADSPA